MNAHPSIEGWDFDATLAMYDQNVAFNPTHLGAPIPQALAKVKASLAAGRKVMIFTARTYPGTDYQRALDATEATLAIAAWCKKHIGQVLPITFMKLPCIGKIIDDRAEQMVANTGIFATELLEAIR